MDVFDFVKFIQAFLAQFAPAAGHFHAAKRAGKVIGKRVVATEPVKAIRGTSGCSTRGSPTSGP